MEKVRDLKEEIIGEVEKQTNAKYKDITDTTCDNTVSTARCKISSTVPSNGTVDTTTNQIKMEYKRSK